MALLDLPTELLRHVLIFLARRDVKTVRLVCKKLKAHAELRINRVFVSAHRIDIDVFNSVTSHPEFRNNVEEIVWDNLCFERFYENHERNARPDFAFEYDRRKVFDTFEREANFECWQENMPGRLRKLEERKRELWGQDYQEISMRQSFDIYNCLYDEQCAILERDEDVQAFRMGLESFPKLKRVTLTSEAWRGLYLSPQYETPLFRSLPPGFRMPMPSTWGWTTTDISYPQDRRFSAIVQHLLDAASRHRVRELAVDVHRETVGIPFYYFQRNQPENWNIQELFLTVPLTRLDLAIDVYRDNDRYCFKDGGTLKTTLSHLVHLEHFHFHTNMPTSYPEQFDYWGDPDDTWLNLQSMFPAENWARLRHLGLANLFTSASSVGTLLSSLPSLQTIDFDTLIFRPDHGTYRSLLQSLKTNLVEPEDGAWRTRKPTMTIRQINGDNETQRITISEEISKYLYEEGDYPFTEEAPNYIGNGFGWILDDFNEEFRLINDYTQWGDLDEAA